jgi:hypothetical protein
LEICPPIYDWQAIRLVAGHPQIADPLHVASQVAARDRLAPRSPHNPGVAMKKLKTLRVGVGVVLALLVIASASIGFAQADPHSGTWVLNVAKSKYSQPAPKSQTTVYTASASSILMSSTLVNAAGTSQTTGFTAMFDGKDAAVKGNPDYDMTSAKRIDANTIEFTRKKAGKVVQTARSVVSADGKTRTVNLTGVNAAGQKINNVSIYEKK